MRVECQSSHATPILPKPPSPARFLYSFATYNYLQFVKNHDQSAALGNYIDFRVRALASLTYGKIASSSRLNSRAITH